MYATRRRRLHRLAAVIVFFVAVYAGVRTFSLWRIGRIGFYDGEWLEFPASPESGYHHPFRIYVPKTASTGGTPTRVWLRPNNTGYDDDPEHHHDEAAKMLAVSRRQADELGVVALVPSFVRPASHPELYTHALDLDTIQEHGALGRLDLQLLAMADAAAAVLRARGQQVCHRVFVDGFSAGGMFTSRFIQIHPKRIAAAASGAPGGWPMVPASRWEGEALRYPVGTADYEDLFDRPYPQGEVARIPLWYYLGSEDTNDATRGIDAFAAGQTEQVDRLFGSTPAARWPAVRQAFAGFNASVDLYEGVGHQQSREMENQLVAFFHAHDRRARCGTSSHP